LQKKLFFIETWTLLTKTTWYHKTTFFSTKYSEHCHRAVWLLENKLIGSQNTNDQFLCFWTSFYERALGRDVTFKRKIYLIKALFNFCFFWRKNKNLNNVLIKYIFRKIPSKKEYFNKNKHLPKFFSTLKNSLPNIWLLCIVLLRSIVDERKYDMTRTK